MSRSLKYATLCSGVECMSAACGGLPLEPVFFSEIEPFPCAVLKHRFPGIPNLGDMSRIRRTEDDRITNGVVSFPIPDGGIDIIAAGCPCQDFSTAGKRAGGEEGSGTRSSLVFELVRIVREIRPRYFIYENVPGMLASNEGRDFANIIMAFRDCGYALAWRTLDAQYVRVDGLERAVPQRRRRVWVVGCAGGDVRRASEVLFERAGLAGDRPPRRVAGQEDARPSPAGDGVAARVVGAAAIVGNVVGRSSDTGGNGVGAKNEVAYTLDTLGGQSVAAEAAPFVKVSHARGRDGEGERWERGELAGTRNAVEGGDGRSQECVVVTNSNGGDAMPTISASVYKGVNSQSDKGGGYVLERRVLAVGFKYSPSERANGLGCENENSPCLSSGCHDAAICLSSGWRTQFRNSSFGAFVRDSVSGTLDTSHMGTVANGMPCVSEDMDAASMRYIVRRLTPTECERLMGLPDGWTLPAFAPSEITDALVEEFRRVHDTFGAVMAAYAGRPAPRPKTAASVRAWLERIADPATCPDAPRYKACGNGWATNQPRWIILRILFFEGIDPWNPEEPAEPTETKGIAT